MLKPATSVAPQTNRVVDLLIHVHIVYQHQLVAADGELGIVGIAASRD